MRVHFAGEGGKNPTKALFDAGVRHRLQSYYDIKFRNADIDQELVSKFSHYIFDSGLFTMMFGNDKNKNFDDAFFDEYIAHYSQFINDHKAPNVSFVELDVQKIRGPEFAWVLRRRLRELCPGASIINVYHVEDGNPDSLIDFCDYIAISQPELRKCVSKSERYRITRYIAAKATSMGKKVHLLGCTEDKYMNDFSFCFSCDSTSWQQVFRYGAANLLGTTLTQKMLLNNRIEEDDKNRSYTYWAGIMMLKHYEKIAGNQR